MNHKRSKIIVNSAGFWAFLFSAAGLLSLNFAEEKIQKRMQRQYSRGQAVVKEQTDQQTAGSTDESNIDTSNTISVYRYNTIPLHAILWTIAAVGIIVLIVDCRLLFFGSDE